MAALAALSGAALASDSVLRGASDVIDKRVIPRVVNSLATRLGDAGDWNSVAGDRVRVGPRAVVKLPYVVQGNDVLRWEFCVRAHDVRFSVSERRMASGGAVEVGLLPSATFAAGSKFGGAWTAKDHTTLLLVFDNAYSLVAPRVDSVEGGRETKIRELVIASMAWRGERRSTSRPWRGRGHKKRAGDGQGRRRRRLGPLGDVPPGRGVALGHGGVPEGVARAPYGLEGVIYDCLCLAR